MSLQGNNLPVFANNFQSNGGFINNATGVGSLGSDTNGVEIFSAGVNGGRVYDLMMTTSDSASNFVFIYILNSGVVYPIGFVTVPANSGNSAGTVAFDAIKNAACAGLPLDATGKPYIELAPDAALKFSVLQPVDLGATLYAATVGANY